MSRVILNDHPWDASEIQYQLDRGRDKEVAKNKELFPPGKVNDEPAKPEDSPTLELHPDVYEFVQNLGTDDLQAELKKHELSAKGDEVELKVRLAQYLQKERDDSDS